MTPGLFRPPAPRPFGVGVAYRATSSYDLPARGVDRTDEYRLGVDLPPAVPLPTSSPDDAVRYVVDAWRDPSAESLSGSIVAEYRLYSYGVQMRESEPARESTVRPPGGPIGGVDENGGDATVIGAPLGPVAVCQVRPYGWLYWLDAYGWLAPGGSCDGPAPLLSWPLALPLAELPPTGPAEMRRWPASGGLYPPMPVGVGGSGPSINGVNGGVCSRGVAGLPGSPSPWPAPDPDQRSRPGVAGPASSVSGTAGVLRLGMDCPMNHERSRPPSSFEEHTGQSRFTPSGCVSWMASSMASAMLLREYRSALRAISEEKPRCLRCATLRGSTGPGERRQKDRFSAPAWESVCAFGT